MQEIFRLMDCRDFRRTGRTNDEGGKRPGRSSRPAYEGSCCNDLGGRMPPPPPQAVAAMTATAAAADAVAACSGGGDRGGADRDSGLGECAMAAVGGGGDAVTAAAVTATARRRRGPSERLPLRQLWRGAATEMVVAMTTAAASGRANLSYTDRAEAGTLPSI